MAFSSEKRDVVKSVVEAQLASKREAEVREKLLAEQEANRAKLAAEEKAKAAPKGILGKFFL